MIAIEPSEVMIAQRAADAAPAMQGTAEEIPLADESVDAAMAVMTDHHWSDRALGSRRCGASRAGGSLR